MPKRTDIQKVLIIGSGPIVIGQACEFDYSGTQACKALREEGYSVILVNSNPATIMTDPETADRVYIEPLTVESLEAILRQERPDALLPTMGGQTALNLAVSLAENGILDRYGVELIGAGLEAIRRAEDRELFKQAMENIGLQVPHSFVVNSLEEGRTRAREIGLPLILRPAFTLGGTGGGIARTWEELDALLDQALRASPVHQVLLEESLIGWKEYELEVMRDRADNVVIICSIENLDPMGVHTGDSITVAPQMTLSDEEYQRMRDAAIAIIREIGVDTGGSNIQFAVHPETGDLRVIEMNPRVSRSSALASKATGFPIAKIAAKLAVGYTLDEIPNDITRETPASFEPVLDYVVVKIPRFAFEKFPYAPRVLTTQMKSVGEVMAIGRSFQEALGKALRALETGIAGFEDLDVDSQTLRQMLKIANPERLLAIAQAFRKGWTVEEVHRLTHIDPWFLRNIQEIVRMEEALKNLRHLSFSEQGALLFQAKRAGLSDKRIATLTGMQEEDIRALRKSYAIHPVYKAVDTCAAEFEAYTPYFYSAYDRPIERITADGEIQRHWTCEARARPLSQKERVVILGAGPNRIGQGIEFDYCCVHAVWALKEQGYAAIMINSNPETVSTDYDVADRLYFEPITLEDVLEVLEVERPLGVLVQFGGQTPLRLALALQNHGVRILGTPPEAIDRAEDREKFAQLLAKLGLHSPSSGTARSVQEALEVGRRLGYPLMVRPSYVLGGRAMEIVETEEELQSYIREAVRVSPEHPVLIDKYLDHAIEVDVDAVCDGQEVLIGGVMEHIEEAGVHSGDSACVVPPQTLPRAIVEEIKAQTRSLALELGVVGLLNVQFAIKDGDIYILEVNPRASRTVPFLSKATGIPLAKIATDVAMGKRLRDLDVPLEPTVWRVAVKEVVFPFDRLSGGDLAIGPEMRSTGEVMGIDEDFGRAYAKARLAAGSPIPTHGKVFISVCDRDKPDVVPLAREFLALGFELVATRGTAAYLQRHGISAQVIKKLREGSPHAVDLIRDGTIGFVVNTVDSRKARRDAYWIREAAVRYGVPYTKTLQSAWAVITALRTLQKHAFTYQALTQ